MKPVEFKDLPMGAVFTHDVPSERPRQWWRKLKDGNRVCNSEGSLLVLIDEVVGAYATEPDALCYLSPDHTPTETPGDARKALSQVRKTLKEATLAMEVAEPLLPEDARSSLELCDGNRDVRGSYLAGDQLGDPLIEVGLCVGKEHGLDRNRVLLRFEAISPQIPTNLMVPALVQAVQSWLDTYKKSNELSPTSPQESP